MVYNSESEMYPDVVEWLDGYLKDMYPKDQILALDSSKSSLVKIIQDNSLSTHLPNDWVTWEIHCDVVGFAYSKGKMKITLVECKLGALNLSHLSQLIGYSKICRPYFSFLISPKGASESLSRLIQTFARRDVLEFTQETGSLPASIAIAMWNKNTKNIDWKNAILDHCRYT
jgi:hypothetical protein